MGCSKNDDNFFVTGYAPIYKDKQSVEDIRMTNFPTSISSAGKIVTQGNIVYVVDVGLGIHLIRYIPPNAPEHIGFIQSKGCNDLAIKNHYLYTNNMLDLVVLNITNPTSAYLLSRTPNVFEKSNTLLPPSSGSYFECLRDNDSVLVGWNLQVLENPKCYYE